MYKIVVVEDEKRVRQGIIMGTDWSKINCIVMGEAENGEEGVEIIRKCRPDIVITDIRMPRMMGIEMIEKVYELGLEPRVIFSRPMTILPTRSRLLSWGRRTIS